MTINKETKSFGMPWEKEYGYAQAVKIGVTIYVSGQVSHDDNGNDNSNNRGDNVVNTLPQQLQLAPLSMETAANTGGNVESDDVATLQLQAQPQPQQQLQHLPVIKNGKK